MAQLCDISAISLANPKYYEAVRRGFMKASGLIPSDLIQEEPVNSAIDSGSDIARQAMFAAVRIVKGAH